MSTTTTNLGLTLPTPNVDTGWGGTLNTDFTLVDNIFAGAGNGTSVGVNVGTGKTLTLGGTMVLGTGDGSGTVTAPTIRGAAKTGTNSVGANLTIDAANGTGSGGSGSIIFRTAPASSSGTTANTMRNVLELTAAGGVNILGSPISSIIPAGSTIPYAGATTPTGWLLCDGSSVSTTTYADLFTAIQYTYGGSGGNFNLPDLRGRAVAGRDDMGGTAAGRITAGGSGITGTNLGAAGGLEYHVLTINQTPSHQHFISNTASGTGSLTASNYVNESAQPSSSNGYILKGSATAPSIGLTSATGGGALHNNTQPTIILNYIIKY